MYEALRKAIKEAESKQNEANIALQAINKHITFSGFTKYDEPKLLIYNNKIILEWHGRELDINAIVDYMENVGYITPYDFS